MGKKNTEKYRISLKHRLYGFGRKNRVRAKLLAWIICKTLPLRKDDSPKHLERIIKQYADPQKLKDRRYYMRLQKDVMFSRIYYRTKYSEYFQFGFERLSDAGRREFIGDYEKTALASAAGTKETQKLLKNKYASYLRFQPYYHREMLLIRSEADREAYYRFLSGHPVFMAKLLRGSQGIQMQKIDMDHSERTADELFQDWMTRIDRFHSEISGLASGDKKKEASEKLQKKGCDEAFVLEEFIEQDPRIAEYHPQSVNTIRLTTYLNDQGEVLHLWAMLAIGRGEGKIADYEGLHAKIDPQTGIIQTEAWSGDGTYHCLSHPDTGIQIIGQKIPRWSDLLRLADELARSIPEQKYIGWDFALTPDGWLVVEGNSNAGMALIQTCSQRGLRPMIDAVFGAGHTV